MGFFNFLNSLIFIRLSVPFSTVTAAKRKGQRGEISFDWQYNSKVKYIIVYEMPNAFVESNVGVSRLNFHLWRYFSQFDGFVQMDFVQRLS